MAVVNTVMYVQAEENVAVVISVMCVQAEEDVAVVNTEMYVQIALRGSDFSVTMIQLTIFQYKISEEKIYSERSLSSYAAFFPL